ncbi:MAG: hypothetical protein ACRESR_04400 [Gammaproteobacteria bacterium]
MMLLRAITALYKFDCGLGLVPAFSLGLAITLSCVGMAFPCTRWLFGRSRVPGRLVQVMPGVSAGPVTGVGAVIRYDALAGVSLRIS